MNKPKNLKAVVFCKNCKHFGICEALPEDTKDFDKALKMPYCRNEWGLASISEESFCSYGELKEMEANDE